METYEFAIVYDPDLEVDLSKGEQKITKLIESKKGKITKTDNWGKKKLAYPIKKHDFGIYVFYEVLLDPLSLAQINTELNITDEVIRFLIVKKDLKALKKFEEEKKIKEERSNLEETSNEE